MARDYNRLFQLPENSATQAGGSSEASTSSSSGLERPSTPLILPEASSATDNPTPSSSSPETPRPVSPTGSEGSNDTVVGYVGPDGRPRIGIWNNR